MPTRLLSALVALAALLSPVRAPHAQRVLHCDQCDEWNVAQRPFRLHGNTWFVGTHGLSAILLTSPAGHILIDAGLPQSAPVIRANIESLGFRLRDVKLIVNSHAHYDHAGGIAELQEGSGARVLASPWSARVIKAGKSQPGDPQLGIALDYPAVPGVETFAFGDTIRVGQLAIVPHATGGHTPGGTTWTWRSCDAKGCLDFVYADSQTPVSAPAFQYSKSDGYPTALADFARGFATLDTLSCDVLVTPHPGVSQLWDRVSADDGAVKPTLVDREACKRYAAGARKALDERLAREKSP